MHIIIESWFDVIYGQMFQLLALVFAMVLVVCIAEAIIRRWKP